MKLYLISQEVNNRYDRYDAFVVCAENEEKAKLIKTLSAEGEDHGDWVKDVKYIKVKYLGEADESIKKGEILGSFNVKLYLISQEKIEEMVRDFCSVVPKSKCNHCKEEHKLKNTGCSNSGHSNSGYYNSGHYNSGYYNSGHYNSGDYNSGYYNSGHYNSGDYNSGDRNSGYYNSGDYNSGDYNSGYYNSGYYNSGWFNTDEPTMRFFNKESSIKYSDFNVQVYPDLKICAWVELNALPINEQTESAKQMGGLLKTLTYKESWAEYWNRASDSDKKWFQELPNFDEKTWEEITGIKLNAPLSLSGKEVSVNVDGKDYKAIIT